jgi:hypothetical protein
MARSATLCYTPGNAFLLITHPTSGPLGWPAFNPMPSRRRSNPTPQHSEAVARRDLIDPHQALLRHRPAILHFSGHGEAQGLLFETRDGEQHLVPRAALVALLANTPSLRCVVLNACHSAVHAEGSTLGAPYLIAMQGTIDDATARAFTQGFYDALAAGHQVEAAFHAGRDRIAVQTQPSEAVPTLFRAEPATTATEK